MSKCWLAYTFILFVFLLCLCTFISQTATPCSDVESLDFYYVTSLLFAITLVIKVVMMIIRDKLEIESICNLVIYIYGLLTHILLLTKPKLFIVRVHNECIPTIEFIQWTLTCPLLYLSLLSCASKKSRWASKIIVIEHVSIVASAISTLAPPDFSVPTVIVSTILSLTAKWTLVRMFFPAQKVLDEQIQPFIALLILFYLCFPITFALRMMDSISIQTELTFFAFNDVLIKIMYALLLEFTSYNVEILKVVDLLDIKRKDTVEKLFLRFIFHEIRNPLSVLTYAVDELAETSTEDEHIANFRAGIYSLSRLLDDLRRMVEMHDGRVLLEESPINLRELILNQIIKAYPAFDQSVIVHCLEDIPVLVGDEYRLTQLVMATLFHCFQQRDDFHKVVLNVRVIKIFHNTYCIELTFSYIAREYSDISNERPDEIMLRPDIYDKEFSLEYTFNKRLAEHICALYNGSFSKTNINEKVCIKVILQMFKYEKQQEDNNKVDDLKLLIVDDNMLQTKRLRKICEPHCGYCVTAQNGKEAVAKAKAEKFDICFMDILMPEMSGIQATRSIRKFDKTIVIYGISANAFRSDYDCMKEAGAVEVFTKPVSKEKIVELLLIANDNKKTK